MEEDPVFWNEQQDCRAVYVAGSCQKTEDSKAVAKYAVIWGRDDIRNCTGLVGGVQSQVRAELTGMKRALQMAVTCHNPKLVFFASSEQVGVEIEQWQEADSGSRLKFENADLLDGIEKTTDSAADFKYWLAQVEFEAQKAGMGRAMMMAETAATLRPITDHNHNLLVNQVPPSIRKVVKPIPTAKVHPVSVIPSSLPTPVALVTILGIKSAKQSIYEVSWGDNDRRNRTGKVHPPVYSFKAEFLALHAALTTAVDINITRVRIQTRVQNVKEIFDKFRLKKVNNSSTEQPYTAIVDDCVKLADMLKEVSIEILPTKKAKEPKAKVESKANPSSSPPNFEKNLDWLNRLTGRLSFKEKETDELISLPSLSELIKEKAFPKIVYIGGAYRKSTGRAAFSVYWAPNDERNRVETVDYVFDTTRTKFLAAEEALKLAIKDGIRNLIVRTDDKTVFEVLNCQSVCEESADVMDEIEYLSERMNSVKFELAPGRAEFRIARQQAEEEVDKFN